MLGLRLLSDSWSPGGHRTTASRSGPALHGEGPESGPVVLGGSLAVVPNAEMGDGFPGARGAEEGSAWFSGQSGLCGRWAGLGREGVCFSPANLVVV